jgi:hypothetical protein
LHEKTPKSTYEIELINPLPFRPQTIYYSPHYDFKYNPNFDDVDNHDISFDKIDREFVANFRPTDIDDSGNVLIRAERGLQYEIHLILP